MKTGRLKTRAGTILVWLGLVTIAHGAATRIPALMLEQFGTHKRSAGRAVYCLDGLLSIGDYKLNAAFAADGRPVCISLSTAHKG